MISISAAPCLDTSNQKLAWADTHLQRLEPELSSPSDYADSISFKQHFDPDARTIEVSLQGVPDLPSEWGLIAADYLQNVRAALNYLAWELSRWNLLRQGETRDPKRITQFPINTVAGQFDARMLPDVHPDHVAIIRRFQPSAIELDIPESYRDLPDEVHLPESFYYVRDQRIAAHPLAHLVKLTNEDKHRALPVAVLGAWEASAGLPKPINCSFGEIGWGRASPQLENGSVWGAVHQVARTGGGEPELQFKDKIVHAQASIGGMWLPHLPACGTFARVIIESFAPVFSV